MRRTSPLSFKTLPSLLNSTPSYRASSNIIQLDNATFYRQYPSPVKQGTSSNPPIFPGLKLSLLNDATPQQHWAVLGPSNSGKTTFLEILRGRHISIPPTARSFPFLSSQGFEGGNKTNLSLDRAIQYVGFNGRGHGLGSSSTRGAYMSARYESRREDTDFSVLEYLTGKTELNPSQKLGEEGLSPRDLKDVIEDLRLEHLVHMPVGNLSNGQTRRARIAKALLGKPELLLLDEPFSKDYSLRSEPFIVSQICTVGLDPPTLTTLSPLLYRLAKSKAPRLLLALRPQDPIPDWITHLIYLEPSLRVAVQGGKDDVLRRVKGTSSGRRSVSAEFGRKLTASGVEDGHENVALSSDPMTRSSEASSLKFNGLPDPGEPLVEMENVQVRYGEKQVLGGWVENIGGKSRHSLHWTVRRGQRWGVFGPNGSGKTTVISLICSDHPQAYSLPIKMFGRGRLPQPGEPGISVFDIQERIGQSSPEIHTFFPKNLTIRRAIENAWAETFLGTPKLTHRHRLTVDAVLRWFEPELNPSTKGHVIGMSPQALKSNLNLDLEWADETRFRDLPFSSQRVALFVRAVVKKPDLVVLDEAFSGMDEHVRDKCMLFLTWGQTRYYQYCGPSNEPLAQRQLAVTESDVLGDSYLAGLGDDQALICVSHVKEEVPNVVRQWICLPEANEGKPARFGRFEAPLSSDSRRWNEIWNM